MNKLLQYMIGAGNVSDKVLPQLAKAQKGFTALPMMQNLTKYDNIPNPAAVRANAERLMQFKKAEANRLAAERQGTITQAAPKRSAASKAWAIATNPMTALSYKAKGLDIPENFERGSRNSLDMAVDMINPFGYANAAATIPGDVASGNIAGAGLKAATLLPFMSEFRGATKGIISRINPWSYQNNLPQNVMYRGIGRAGMEDALQSGVFRANPNVTPTSIGNFNTTKQFSKAYFSPKFNVADDYGQGFIAEVPRAASDWGKRYGRKQWSQIAQRDIPITEGRILQKDWLMGYKPVNTRSNVQAFGPNNSNSGLLNYLKSNSYVNPLGTAIDYTLGTYKGLRNQYKGLLSGKRRPYFEAFPATEAQKAKVMGMQDEAMKDALDFTKNYWYENGSSDIRPILENKMREILPDLKMASNQSNLERTIDGVPNSLNPFTNTSDRLIPATSWGKGREGLSQDVIDALTEDRGLIGGINIPDKNLSLTLRNQGRYYKTPKEIANTVVHESGHTAQNFGVLGAMDEQGIRGMNKTWGEVTTKFDPEYNYFTSNPDTELGRRFKDALVEPYKTSNPFNSQTWRSSPNELHSELMAGKYNLYKQALREGLSAEEAMTRATNPLGRELNWLLENKNLNRHFKPTTPHEEKLKLLKLLPAAAPVVAGAALSEQKYGGQPCYKCGGQKMPHGGPILDSRGQWAHPGQITRIPSPSITMQGVPYPVFGIGSNGQQQMMYPGQEYNFGGASYVDEYPVMGKGGEMIRRADGSYSRRGLWDNIRANKGSGKKPTKQMLEQERKITKAQMGLWNTDKLGYLDSTVNANQNLEFIQRAMQNNGPSIPTPKGAPGYRQGMTSSHLMTYDPKSARSYPELVSMNGSLKYLTGDDAYNYAEDTGEYIQFPTAQQAQYFSKNYKKSNYIKVGKQPLEKKHGINVTYKK